VKARIAMIGCGSWATEAHMPALAAAPDADLVAVVDPREDAREAAARRFGVARTYASHEELLADAPPPDGVIVATPHAHHLAPARAALEAGAHVLVEKPLTIRPEDASELVRLARGRGRELLVGYTFHYNRQAHELRELIRGRALGEIELVHCLFASLVRDYYAGDTESYQPELKLARAPLSNTYSDPALAGGGQGQTQVTHSAALALWLTGLRPRRVAAFTENRGLPVDLVDAAAVSFADGAIGTLASTGDRPTGVDDFLHLHIAGTKGLAHYEVLEGRATVYLHDGERIELEGVPAAEIYPHWGPSQNLVELVLGRGENRSPGELGATVVALLDGMYRSSAAGGAAVDLL
jgi:predicted dehydrogenase